MSYYSYLNTGKPLTATILYHEVFKYFHDGVYSAFGKSSQELDYRGLKYVHRETSDFVEPPYFSEWWSEGEECVYVQGVFRGEASCSLDGSSIYDQDSQTYLDFDKIGRINIEIFYFSPFGFFIALEALRTIEDSYEGGCLILINPFICSVINHLLDEWWSYNPYRIFKYAGC